MLTAVRLLLLLLLTAVLLLLLLESLLRRIITCRAIIRQRPRHNLLLQWIILVLMLRLVPPRVPIPNKGPTPPVVRPSLVKGMSASVLVVAERGGRDTARDVGLLSCLSARPALLDLC